MTFVLGLILGLVRESLVVKYYQAIPRKRAVLGSVLTLVIGLLDIGVLARLALDRDIWMIAGYTLGESIGTFLMVKMGK